MPIGPQKVGFANQRFNLFRFQILGYFIVMKEIIDIAQVLITGFPSLITGKYRFFAIQAPIVNFGQDVIAVFSSPRTPIPNFCKEGNAVYKPLI